MRCHKAMLPVLIISTISYVPICTAGAPGPASEQTPGPLPEQTAGQPATEKADPSPDEREEGRFLRVARDDEGSPVALEAAIVRCVPRDCGNTGPTVDLVSAVHVAEKSYYEELNRLFKSYDAVLFELVAPEGTQIPEGGVGPTGNPVSIVQNAMTNMLKLEFQLKGLCPG